MNKVTGCVSNTEKAKHTINHHDFWGIFQKCFYWFFKWNVASCMSWMVCPIISKTGKFVSTKLFMIWPNLISILISFISERQVFICPWVHTELWIKALQIFCSLYLKSMQKFFRLCKLVSLHQFKEDVNNNFWLEILCLTLIAPV